MGMENNFERGPEKNIEKVTCPNCQGTGKVDDSDGKKVTCPKCKGTGVNPIGG